METKKNEKSTQRLPISSQVPASQLTSSMTLDQLVLFLKSESEVLYLCIISFFSPFWSQPHELLSKLMKMQGNAMHYRLRCSLGRFLSQKKFKSKVLFLSEKRVYLSKSSCFDKVMTQIFHQKNCNKYLKTK